MFGLLQERQLTDLNKKIACFQENITLIQVPYSWNGEPIKLIEFIKEALPNVELSISK